MSKLFQVFNNKFNIFARPACRDGQMSGNWLGNTGWSL